MPATDPKFRKKRGRQKFENQPTITIMNKVVESKPEKERKPRLKRQKNEKEITFREAEKTVNFKQQPKNKRVKKQDLDLQQATINFDQQHGKSIGPSVRTAKQIRDLEKAEFLFSDLQNEPSGKSENKENEILAESATKKKVFQMKRGDIKSRSNRTSGLENKVDIQDSSSSDNKQEQIQIEKNGSKIEKGAESKKNEAKSKKQESDIEDSISETDESVVSLANNDLGQYTYNKFMPKNGKKLLKKDNLSRSTSTTNLASLNSDNFFSGPLKTRIKYESSEMKQNKFKNLFSRDQTDLSTNQETKEMQ